MTISNHLIQATSPETSVNVTFCGTWVPSITQALHHVQDADTALLARNTSAAMTQHRQAALLLRGLFQPRRTA